MKKITRNIAFLGILFVEFKLYGCYNIKVIGGEVSDIVETLHALIERYRKGDLEKMASEMINQVLDAEKVAAEKETAARAKAAEIIKAAEAEAKATAEAGKVAAAKEKEQILEKAQKKADEIYADARAQAQSQKATLLKSSEDKMDESVAAVIKHIIP